MEKEIKGYLISAIDLYFSLTVGLNGYIYIWTKIRSSRLSLPLLLWSLSPSSGRSKAPTGGFWLVSAAQTRWWSSFVKSTSDKGESKRRVYWWSGGFLQIPATPAAYCFESEWKLEDNTKLYCFWCGFSDHKRSTPVLELHGGVGVLCSRREDDKGVGLLGNARSLQRDLNQITETANTATSKGLSYILTDFDLFQPYLQNQGVLLA